MLIEYIERLRKEPKEVRRQAVFFWSLVVVVLIGFLYLGIVAARTTLTNAEEVSAIAAPYESSP